MATPWGLNWGSSLANLPRKTQGSAYNCVQNTVFLRGFLTVTSAKWVFFASGVRGGKHQKQAPRTEHPFKFDPPRDAPRDAPRTPWGVGSNLVFEALARDIPQKVEPETLQNELPLSAGPREASGSLVKHRVLSTTVRRTLCFTRLSDRDIGQMRVFRLGRPGGGHQNQSPRTEHPFKCDV